jgi:hypothetical protein
MNLQGPLLLLQAFQVAFLWLHDWIPLGRLNDIAAVRRQDSLRRLITVTLLQSVPWTLGLVFSVQHFGQHQPGWLRQWLWISYGILFCGELRAWWLPYLLFPDAQRAERYRELFGNTHAFLPQRNGMVPNTLHVVLHAATLMTLLVLAAVN